MAEQTLKVQNSQVMPSWLSGRHWMSYAAACCMLCSVFFSFPAIEHFLQFLGFSSAQRIVAARPEMEADFEFGGWKEFKAQAAAPLEPADFDPASHYAKRSFRLFPPLVAKVFHLGPRGMILFQCLGGFLLFWLMLRLGYLVSASKAFAMLSALNIGLIYTGYSFFSALLAQFDSLAFAAVMLALCSHSLALLALAFQAALWVDERSLLSGVVWILCLYAWNLQPRPTVLKQAAVLVVSVLLYLVVRFTLGLQFGLSVPMGSDSGVGLSQLLRANEFFWPGMWSYFRGLWLVIFAVIFLHWKTATANERRACLVVYALLLALCLTPFVAFDITRSGSYLFPILLAAIPMLCRVLSLEAALKLMLISLAVSILSGPLYLIAAPLEGWMVRGLTVAHKTLPQRLLDFLYYYYL